MSAAQPKSIDEFQNLVKFGKTIVFFSSEWCKLCIFYLQYKKIQKIIFLINVAAPCKMLNTFFEELYIKYPSFKYVKVDVNQINEANVMSLPSFYLYGNFLFIFLFYTITIYI